MKWLPNLITLVRFVLVLPVALAIAAGRPGLALLLFTIAGLSDALDGALARRGGWTSRFGALADPVADKLLMATVLVVLAADGTIPLLVCGAVLLRDAVVAGGALAWRVLLGPLEVRPLRMGKVTTAAEVGYVIIVLAAAALPATPEDAAVLLAALGLGVAALAVVSGGQYVWVYSQRARQAWRGR